MVPHFSPLQWSKSSVVGSVLLIFVVSLAIREHSAWLCNLPNLLIYIIPIHGFIKYTGNIYLSIYLWSLWKEHRESCSWRNSSKNHFDHPNTMCRKEKLCLGQTQHRCRSLQKAALPGSLPVWLKWFKKPSHWRGAAQHGGSWRVFHLD